MAVILPVAACLSIAICLLIDTSGWWIRTLSNGSNMGYYVSRTNLYTYFGRLFAFTYMSLLSLFIETGANTKAVCVLVIASFCIGAIIHVFLLNKSNYSRYFIVQIAKLMRLPVDTKLNEQIAINYGNKLLLSTTVSTTLFCLGMSAPYILASLFRSYRLTLASTGQILNAIGMIFILLFVDLLMFKSWDDKELQHAIKYYSRGRVLGILLAASIVAMSLLYTHS